MAKIAMLWVGSPLTGVQRLSMRSFIHHGHRVSLYTYNSLEAPDGVELLDAGEILPKEALFQSHGSFAAFSDVFRYNLLTQSDVIWADADTLCLRDDWNFQEYLFAYQEPYKVTNNILAYPKESLLAQKLKENAIYEQGKAFDELGPKLLTATIAELGLGNYVLPEYTFNPLHWTQYSITYKPEMRDEVLLKCKNSHAVGLSNYLLAYHKFNRDEFPKGSALDYWNELFRQ